MQRNHKTHRDPYLTEGNWKKQKCNLIVAEHQHQLEKIAEVVSHTVPGARARINLEKGCAEIYTPNDTVLAKVRIVSKGLGRGKNALVAFLALPESFCSVFTDTLKVPTEFKIRTKTK